MNDIFDYFKVQLISFVKLCVLVTVIVPVIVAILEVLYFSIRELQLVTLRISLFFILSKVIFSSVVETFVPETFEYAELLYTEEYSSVNVDVQEHVRLFLQHVNARVTREISKIFFMY